MTGITLLALAAAMVVAAFVLLFQEMHVRVTNVHVAKVIGGSTGPSVRLNTMNWLSALGLRYRRFYSPENLEQQRTIIQAAGFNPYRTMPLLIGVRTVSMIFIPMIAVLFGLYLEQPLMGVVFIFAGPGTIIGIMGPRWILSYLRRRVTLSVQRGTPDAIDLLVVCSESGMGLESGLQQVANEMNRSNPPLARVLGGLLDDLRILPDRRQAFVNLAERSTSEGLRRFGTMIDQSLQYGTPLGTTLRAIAEELRRDRMIKLEERAHKLGAKLLMPMVMFMLPAMFITFGASPFLHLMHTLN